MKVFLKSVPFSLLKYNDKANLFQVKEEKEEEKELSLQIQSGPAKGFLGVSELVRKGRLILAVAIIGSGWI